MLKHCVLIQFKDGISESDRQSVLSGFGELVKTIEGMVDYCYGPNLDFENKSANYQYGFIVTFENREAHLAYEQHPRHVELGGKLVSMAKGGVDGILVFDLKI